MSSTDSASDQIIARAPAGSRLAPTVERLLMASLVEVAVEDPSSDDAQFCIDQYFREIDARFDNGFDPSIANSAGVDELTEPAGLLLVARLRGDPVGCGALKFHGTSPAEIKRLWVSAGARGIGLGKRILTDLERRAAANGAAAVQLDTNRNLTEAIAMYRSSGYVEIPAFNSEPHAHHWFEKPLR